MNKHNVIADLEAQGFTVYPPRDVQANWERDVALLLQSFHLIQRPYERHDVDIRERSRVTLGLIRDGIEEMLSHE